MEKEEENMNDGLRLEKKGEILKSENIMKIMNNPMTYVIESIKYKSVFDIKKDLIFMKNVIHNDIIKILNKNSKEFMSLPANLNYIENMIPILDKEIKISKRFVKKLLNEINNINKSINEILIDKINIFYIKNILKVNIDIYDLINKIEKELKKYEKSECYNILIDIQKKMYSYNYEMNNILSSTNTCSFLIEDDIYKNNIYFLYDLAKRLINISTCIWNIKAMMYNNYKRIKTISDKLQHFYNLLNKYGIEAKCEEQTILVTMNKYSFENLNEKLKNVIDQVEKKINELSYIFLKLLKNGFIQNINENNILNQSLNYILNSCYLINYFKVFIVHFQEVYINYIEYEPFDTYEDFLLYVKEKILENKNVQEICKRINEIDDGVLFCAYGILERILEIIKNKFGDIFMLRYSDIFMERYIKTTYLFNDIKKLLVRKSKYELFILDEKMKKFLKTFERDGYVQYVLNLLENKMNDNYKNVILFDKKYIFENNFYWLKETINLIKIFKILFTSKYYIPDCLANYLSFIFKHFKNYITNVETFLLFLEENEEIKISIVDKKKINKFQWSPTLGYNTIGFFISDFLSLRKIFKTSKNIYSYIKNDGQVILPNNIGDVSKWMFTKILNNFINQTTLEEKNAHMGYDKKNIYVNNNSSSNINDDLITSSSEEDENNMNIMNMQSKNMISSNIHNDDKIKLDYAHLDDKQISEHDIKYRYNANKSDDTKNNERDIYADNNDMHNNLDVLLNNENKNYNQNIDHVDILYKIGNENKNILRERKKKKNQTLYFYEKNNKKKIIHHIRCINGFLKTLTKIVINTQKIFEDFFINKMFEICSSFLIYLHSLLTVHKMTSKRIPEKPSEQVEKIVLPLISFKTFYQDIIADIIIEDIITKIVDKISEYYLNEIKNVIDAKICEQNKRSLKFNLIETFLKKDDVPYEEKIQQQIYLDVCQYEKLCDENFMINKNTNINMRALINHCKMENKKIKG
ncbi:hypothetical protein PGSY75_1130500 [Plasmodium gaboni]|uniref:COG complex component COG2 C-terminal domain-containing protein n=1 Tax=Plasmodium gaboni TaxID=647221 RepID=A0A151LIY6_9APIC|nr:hypothetical protein PGSY75_1130500 [Plasmodium gaboni]KYN98941.1 hypothetical protein PGSY75_1130500 [Plasmodium gaboni]